MRIITYNTKLFQMKTYLKRKILFFIPVDINFEL